MDRGGGQGEPRTQIPNLFPLLIVQIERDEADLAVQGFSFTYARAQVAVLQPAVSYLPYYWWTR